MNKLKLFILSLFIFFPFFTHASVLGVQSGGTGASTLTGCLTGHGIGPITGTGSACGSGGSTPLIASTELWVDGNRTDSYAVNGSIEKPFTSLTSAVGYANGSTTITTVAIHVAPVISTINSGAYLEQSLSVNKNIIIYDNNSTIIMMNGGAVGDGTLTFNNDFDCNSCAIFGDVIGNDSSLTNPHTFENSLIVGNLTLYGLAIFTDGTVQDRNKNIYPFLNTMASSTFLAASSSLVDFTGGDLQVIAVNQGSLQLDNAGVNVTSNTSSAIVSTATSSSLGINGATIVNLGTGGCINTNNLNKATPPDTISSVKCVLGVGTPSAIYAGASSLYLANYTASDVIGNKIYASSTGYLPLNTLGIEVDGDGLYGSNHGLPGFGTSTFAGNVVIGTTTNNNQTLFQVWKTTSVGPATSPCVYFDQTVNQLVTGCLSGNSADGNTSQLIRDRVGNPIFSCGGGLAVNCTINAAGASASIVLQQQSVEHFRVATNGFVGVNTSTPVAPLSVSGDTFITGNITGTNITATGTITQTSTGTSTFTGNVVSSCFANSVNGACITGTGGNTINAGTTGFNAYYSGPNTISATTTLDFSNGNLNIGTTTQNGAMVTIDQGSRTDGIDMFLSTGSTNFLVAKNAAGTSVVTISSGGAGTFSSTVQGSTIKAGNAGNAIAPAFNESGLQTGLFFSTPSLGSAMFASVVGATSTAWTANGFGIGTSSPFSRLAVVGSSTNPLALLTLATSTGTSVFSVDSGGGITLQGSSTVTTPSISGALVSIGCDTVTTTVDASVSSTTAFITTPQTFPGINLYWQSYLSSAGVITTEVCSTLANVTPTASVYNVKILKGN